MLFTGNPGTGRHSNAETGNDDFVNKLDDSQVLFQNTLSGLENDGYTPEVVPKHHMAVVWLNDKVVVSVFRRVAIATRDAGAAVN